MELANQFGAGIIVAYLIEYLKKSNKFHFLNEEHSARYKSIIGFIAALLTTVGIHYTFDYDISSGGIVTLLIPGVGEIFHSLWDFAKQWAFQQASYDGFVRKAKQ